MTALYMFELHFTAPADSSLIDALYEAGWDDATVSFDPEKGGLGIAAFDREAPSAVEAVASAITQGRSAGIEINAVTEDLVTLGEIAERVGRTFSTVDHWAAGRRGPGTFPEPRIGRPRASLWSWAEVVTWLHDNDLAGVSLEDVDTALVCRLADSLLRVQAIQRDLPERTRELLFQAVA